MRKAPFPALLFTAATLAVAAEPQALRVGSAAPTLKVGRWVKDRAAIEPGRVTVVEFWATWCGPCRETIPHLTRMAQAYGDKVTFIGVDVWEREAKPDAKVDAFVQEMGERMGYPVAQDTADGTMAATWMKAAGRGSIPTAFIVDGQGRIAWIGHPMSGLKETLDAILAGKHDLAVAAREEEAARLAAEARRARQAALQKRFLEAAKALEEGMKAGDWKRVLQLVDEAEAAEPQFKDAFQGQRLVALIHLDEPKAHALVKAEEAKPKPFPQGLASVVARAEGLPDPWYRWALGVLEAHPEINPVGKRNLARLQARMGRMKEALATQEAVLAWARAQAGFPKKTLEELERELETYRKAVEAAAKG